MDHRSKLHLNVEMMSQAAFLLKLGVQHIFNHLWNDGKYSP